MTYSVKLDGNPIFYRLYENRYSGVVEEGKTIEFEATPNSDGKSANVVKGTIREFVPAQAAAPGAPALGNPNDGRQNSIVYQSSRKDAVAFVDILLREKAVKLPKAQADAKGAIEALLDRVTAQFFNDTQTLGAVVREAQSEGEPEAEAPAAEEDDE
jgi:hypothetical protein